MTSPQSSNAERQARHRRGLKAKLLEIKGAIEDLRADVREVMAARMVRKSISNSESRHAD